MVLRKQHRIPKKQTGFNSYVAPSADHALQVDLFEYKFKQTDRPNMNHTFIDGKEYDIGRAYARKMAKVNPYGTIAINPFTKKVHVESVLGKHRRDDCKPALQQTLETFENQSRFIPILTLPYRGMK